MSIEARQQGITHNVLVLVVSSGFTAQMFN